VCSKKLSRNLDFYIFWIKFCLATTQKKKTLTTFLSTLSANTIDASDGGGINSTVVAATECIISDFFFFFSFS